MNIKLLDDMIEIESELLAFGRDQRIPNIATIASARLAGLRALRKKATSESHG